MNFKYNIRFAGRTDTGSKLWDSEAKDFGFDKSGKLFILKEGVAPDVFLLEGTPGKAGDSFLLHEASLREERK